MAKLGTEKRPAVVRVQTEERASEIASICNEHGWYYIIGFEPDKPEVMPPSRDGKYCELKSWEPTCVKS
jgi:hypothetical protein